MGGWHITLISINWKHRFVSQIINIQYHLFFFSRQNKCSTHLSIYCSYRFWACSKTNLDLRVVTDVPTNIYRADIPTTHVLDKCYQSGGCMHAFNYRIFFTGAMVVTPFKPLPCICITQLPRRISHHLNRLARNFLQQMQPFVKLVHPAIRSFYTV